MSSHESQPSARGLAWLELRLPPPLVLLATMGLSGLGAWAWPAGVWLQLPTALALVPVVPGLALGVIGLVHFVRARTTFHPHCPERTRALVIHGVYRFSRNPMYLGLALLLLAWLLYLGHLLGPLWLAGFIAYLTRFQILPEERALRAHFGEAYTQYCASTRRWL